MKKPRLNKKIEAWSATIRHISLTVSYIVTLLSGTLYIILHFLHFHKIPIPLHLLFFKKTITNKLHLSGSYHDMTTAMYKTLAFAMF